MLLVHLGHVLSLFVLAQVFAALREFLQLSICSATMTTGVASLIVAAQAELPLTMPFDEWMTTFGKTSNGDEQTTRQAIYEDVAPPTFSNLPPLKKVLKK